MAIIVSNVFSPDRGGIQTMMAALANEAASEPGGAIVIAPTFRGYAEFDRTVRYRMIRVPDVPRPFDAVVIGLAFVKALMLTRERFTLAANWWPSALPLVLIPRALRGKIAIFVHGSEIAPDSGGLRRVMMRWILGRADCVLANSTFTRELLARAGVSDRVDVIPLGVDMAPIEPARAREPTLLSVGRLVERKGFDKVIEALVRLRETLPNVRYEIVGEGPDRARLERLAAQLDVAELVRFRGKLSHDDMRAAYARAWCFALPVRTVGSDVEGFGIVYLEAAMARLPTIGGLHSGATDAIDDGVTGYLVDGADGVAVYDAIARVLEDPVAAAQMGERGFERASGCTWKQTFQACRASLRR